MASGGLRTPGLECPQAGEPNGVMGQHMLNESLRPPQRDVHASFGGRDNKVDNGVVISPDPDLLNNEPLLVWIFSDDYGTGARWFGRQIYTCLYQSRARPDRHPRSSRSISGSASIHYGGTSPPCYELCALYSLRRRLPVLPMPLCSTHRNSIPWRCAWPAAALAIKQEDQADVVVMSWRQGEGR